MTIAAVMVLIVVALACVAPPPPPPNHAPEPFFAARYGAGLMERVARKRGLKFRAGGENCGMTVDWAPLGSLLLVTGARTGVSRICESVDVSQSVDLARHIRDRLVELDSHSALVICGARYFKSRWKECPVHVSKYPESPNPTRSRHGS